ncbi:ATP-binding protein [Pedobacter yulinensis]|uniref:histidine kinase n=1 Tax=Pedobacter yulinensis TaxID=2126353 RepID=A0A2T3HME7_9SPHI|nr:HAMP domain-containing sensor histidine kinase [Pedobacter yulinensis]PST83541.1 ATP-binding protein [Pedobacter yulinensis]
MFYQQFTFRLMCRLLVINLLAALLFYLVSRTELWFTIAGVSMILAGALVSLFSFVNEIRSDIRRFVLAVKTRDHTLNFRNKSTIGSFPELYTSFDEIIQSQKSIQLEQEAMYQLMKTILEQVPAGVIVIKDPQAADRSEVVFFNQAASSMLNVPAYKYWQRVERHLPEFGAEVRRIMRGGKRFIELRLQEKLIQLSTEVIPLQLYQTNYTIISFQNIKDEIEQKETEAWNRLIGVISHEILNSITPISSLSDTLNSMVAGRTELGAAELEDLVPAVQTIKRRSEGLLDFVKDYRLIAELPTPRLELHSIGEILSHTRVLMRPFAEGKNVQLGIGQTSSKVSIWIDIKLVEQVLINLITNAIYAVEEVENPQISIGYRLEQNRLLLEVQDNGKGIAAENLEKIFVPFFTTRKNGSGIGLTISRNIMKMHKGSIEVSSQEGLGATFALVFNYN